MCPLLPSPDGETAPGLDASWVYVAPFCYKALPGGGRDFATAAADCQAAATGANLLQFSTLRQFNAFLQYP